MTRPEEGERFPTAGGHLLAGGSHTGGRVTVIESTAPPGNETPPHVHGEMDETFYILDGSYTVRCGEETFTATPGCFVYLPHGIPHSWQAGPQGGRKLILGLPSGLEGFFRDMADMSDWEELGRRHGITFL